MEVMDDVSRKVMDPFRAAGMNSNPGIVETLINRQT